MGTLESATRNDRSPVLDLLAEALKALVKSSTEKLSLRGMVVREAGSGIMSVIFLVEVGCLVEGMVDGDVLKAARFGMLERSGLDWIDSRQQDWVYVSRRCVMVGRRSGCGRVMTEGEQFQEMGERGV